MDDLISRQEAIDALKYETDYLTSAYICNGHTFLYKESAIEQIRALPTVQPKRGKWIHGERRKFIDLANADEQYKILGYPHRLYVNMTCSCCRMITIADETILYNYCPHCGADMRGEHDE